MKKLLSLLAIALFSISASYAQATVAVPVSKQTAKNVNAAKAAVPAAKKEVKKVETKAVATKAAATNTAKTVTRTTASKAAKLKADGTPDMRYAENKTKAVTVQGPKKKDGTADMRYKANKAATKKN